MSQSYDFNFFINIISESFFQNFRVDNFTRLNLNLFNYSSARFSNFCPAVAKIADNKRKHFIAFINKVFKRGAHSTCAA